MKNILYLFAFLFCFAAVSQAQSTTTKTITSTIRLDKNSTVKDSAGVKYDPETWSSMINSGKYTIRPSGGTAEAPEFTLYKQTLINGKPVYKPRESEYFTTGELFKPFKQKDIKGEKLDIKALVGKVIVVNFWFANCPPCRAEIPELNKLVEKYQSNPDVVFIAIALDQKDVLENFLKLFPYNYHIIDDGRYLAGKYGIKSYPTNVIVDRQGKVKFHSSGYGSTTPYWIDKEIGAALNAQM